MDDARYYSICLKMHHVDADTGLAMGYLDIDEWQELIAYVDRLRRWTRVRRFVYGLFNA